MGWVGNHISSAVVGLSWPIVYVTLIVGYILIHYFFVSQTAQMLSLFRVFLGVAGEIYKVGGIITILNMVVFLTVGTAWILLVT